MTNKPTERPVNSVLLLDKPEGLPSNTALQKTQRLFRAKKAGHTGVLDPLATGLLSVCFGEAIKFAQYLINVGKAYTAILKLSEVSSTGDAEGEITATVCVDISLSEFQTACQALTGGIRQVPPMSSALKREGEPLYEHARKGIVIERKTRDITTYSIDITEFGASKTVIDVRCSKDTYIRTLSEDTAKHIGTFAHLTTLRRIETAGSTIAQSHTFGALAELDEAERDALLLPCDVLVQYLPKLELNDYAVTMLKHGQRLQLTENISTEQLIRVYNRDGTFIGLVEYQKGIGRLKTSRLMNIAD